MKKLLLCLTACTGTAVALTSCKAGTAVHSFFNPAYRRFKNVLEKWQDAVTRGDVKESKVQMEIAKSQYQSYSMHHSKEQHWFTKNLQKTYNKLLEDTLRLSIK